MVTTPYLFISPELTGNDAFPLGRREELKIWFVQGARFDGCNLKDSPVVHRSVTGRH